MIVHDWRLEYSERVYAILLSFYPVETRARFGPDMLQLFRDCCRYEIREGGARRLLIVWIRALKDIALSILQEQGRALIRPIGAAHPLVALADSLLIPAIVGINLVVLGPVATALLLRLEPARVPLDEFVVTSAMASLILGGLGILRALVVARLRPTVRLWVKLS